MSEDWHEDPGWIAQVEREYAGLQPYDREQRTAVFEAMQRYGGGFVTALSWAFLRADPSNEVKLRAAFPEVFAHYERLAREEEGEGGG